MKRITKSKLKKGISGIMRVKNDGMFIRKCILSCIEALDELIIVWNDCTDNSVEEILSIKELFPEKIKTYPYEHTILSLFNSKEEYESAKSLPLDSPHLLHNYYNFALSKVSYEYAIKIDADQIYITPVLMYWSKIIHMNKAPHFSLAIIQEDIKRRIYGMMYRIANKKGYFIPLQPISCVNRGVDTHLNYLAYMLLKKHFSLSFSGLNVVKIKNEWYTTLGYKDEGLQLPTPFNGAGDHLLFWVNECSRYRQIDSPVYAQSVNKKFALIELFENNTKILNAGYLWYHMSMMRPDMHKKVENYFVDIKKYFMPVQDFLKYSFSKVLKVVTAETFTSTSKVLHSFQYSYYSDILRKNLYILKD